MARSRSASVPSDVRVHAALDVLVRGWRVGGEFLQAVVEQAVVVGPGGRSELRAVDRLAGLLSGRDLDHLEDALFGPSRRNAVGDVLVVRRRREVVDGEMLTAFVLDRLGVDEHALLACEPRPHVELGEVLLREPLQVIVVAVVDLDARHARRDRVAQLGDPAQQRVPARNAIECRARVVGLRLDPRDRIGILLVLEVPVGIRHGDAEVRLGDGAHRRNRRRRLRVAERGRREQDQGPTGEARAT